MRGRNLCLFIWIGLLLLLFDSTAWPKNSILPKTGKAKATVKPAENFLPLQPLTPEKVDAHLAGLTNAQARQVLAQKLKQEAAPSRPKKKQSHPRRAGRRPGACLCPESAGSFGST